jgi:hypothetical protein
MTVIISYPHHLTTVLIAYRWIRRNLQRAGWEAFQYPREGNPRACVNLLFVSHCLGGFDGTSNVLDGKLFKIPVKGTYVHAHIYYSSLIA